MLARSLVVFIAVGVVSGLLFGTYLAGLKDANQVTYVDGHSLSVVTDKSIYEPDEAIKIRIINSGTLPLDFHNAAYGFYVTDLLNIRILTPGLGCQEAECHEDILTPAGIVMFTPGPEALDATLDPGEEVVLSWNQIQNDETPVIAGVYKIHAESSSAAASTTVTIL